MYPISPLDIVRQLIYMHYVRLNPYELPDGPLDLDPKEWFGNVPRP